MVIESVAIIMIIAVVMFGYLRTNKKEYALVTLPLLVLPFTNVIAEILCETISKFDGLTISIVTNFSGLILTGVLLFLTSKNLPTKKKQIVFIILALIYSIALFLIFVCSRIPA
ncbi:MAG: hypothetical protein RR036_00590 [Oscillospiraceae bacterium]